MSGSGVSKLTMSKRGATAKSLKGNYPSKAGALAKKSVHNQPKSKGGKK